MQAIILASNDKHTKSVAERAKNRPPAAWENAALGGALCGARFGSRVPLRPAGNRHDLCIGAVNLHARAY